MSAILEWREGSSSTKKEFKEDDIISITNEMSGMYFEPARHSVNRSMSLDKKAIWHRTRTVS